MQIKTVNKKKNEKKEILTLTLTLVFFHPLLISTKWLVNSIFFLKPIVVFDQYFFMCDYNIKIVCKFLSHRKQIGVA
jgi:hypothetical protein